MTLTTTAKQQGKAAPNKKGTRSKSSPQSKATESPPINARITETANSPAKETQTNAPTMIADSPPTKNNPDKSNTSDSVMKPFSASPGENSTKKRLNRYKVRHFYFNKLLIARFERELYPNAKTFVDYLAATDCAKEAGWCKDIHLSSTSFYLHDKNGDTVKSYPGSKYGKRVFFYNGTYEFPNHQEAIEYIRTKLCPKYISNLNTRVKADQHLSIPDEDDILLTFDSEGVLSDYVGQDAAGETLIEILGEDYSPADFNIKSPFIFSFFRKGEIPSNIASILGASADDVKKDSK